MKVKVASLCPICTTVVAKLGHNGYGLCRMHGWVNVAKFALIENKGKVQRATSQHIQH